MKILEILNEDSPKSKALRVKQIRGMLNLNTSGLAKLIGCTRQTISYWENAVDNKEVISKKGAKKLIEVAEKRGVFCNMKWLMFGVGYAQIGRSLNTENDSILVEKTDDDLIEIDTWKGGLNELKHKLYFFREIESFFMENETAVVARIKDYALEPIYEKGDWVAGQLTIPSENLDGKVCIVEINGQTQVRLIKLGKTKETFNVSYMKKTNETESEFELKNIKIKNVATITRFWREDK